MADSPRLRDRRAPRSTARPSPPTAARSSWTSTRSSRRTPSTTSSRLARQGYYDGLTFHRVVPDFVIQGGCPEGTRYAAAPATSSRDEPVQGEYTLGAVAMANAGPNTNGSQFFICIDDCTRKLTKELQPLRLRRRRAWTSRSATQVGDVMQSVVIEEHDA